MAYLTFAEYGTFGGGLTEAQFNVLEPKAERKLDYFTQDRLKTATTIISEVKELLTEFIDKMAANKTNSTITSYGNGIESFGFAENSTQVFQNELYQLAIEYLPIELISAYCGETSEV